MVFSPSDFNGYFPFVCSALPNALLASFSVFRAKFFEFAKKLDPDNAVKLWKERTISTANDAFWGSRSILSVAIDTPKATIYWPLSVYCSKFLSSIKISFMPWRSLWEQKVPNRRSLYRKHHLGSLMVWPNQKFAKSVPYQNVFGAMAF